MNILGTSTAQLILVKYYVHFMKVICWSILIHACVWEWSIGNNAPKCLRLPVQLAITASCSWHKVAILCLLLVPLLSKCVCYLIKAITWWKYRVRFMYSTQTFTHRHSLTHTVVKAGFGLSRMNRILTFLLNTQRTMWVSVCVSVCRRRAGRSWDALHPLHSVPSLETTRIPRKSQVSLPWLCARASVSVCVCVCVWVCEVICTVREAPVDSSSYSGAPLEGFEGASDPVTPSRSFWRSVWSSDHLYKVLEERLI